MNFRQLARARAGRVLCGALLLCAAACRGETAGGEPSLALGGQSLSSPAARAEAKAAAEAAARRAQLAQAPLDELSFVPADAEAIVRVDLAALAARDAHAAHALDYLLRAQQPSAWEFLTNAGIAPGKELRAIYLVVGAHAGGAPTFAVAGVGEIDVARVSAALRRGGAIVEPAPGGGALFTWKDPRGADAKVNASIPPEKGWDKVGVDGRVGEAAIGVAAGLLLVGQPDLVRAALRVRGGEGKDLRTTPVADALLAIDTSAVTWGVARAPADAASSSYLDGFAHGMRQARFHAALSGIGKGTVEIHAEFATPAEAVAFRGVLDQFLADTAKLTGDTPLGKSLARLRENAKIAVDGGVLTVYALL